MGIIRNGLRVRIFLCLKKSIKTLLTNTFSWKVSRKTNRSGLGADCAFHDACMMRLPQSWVVVNEPGYTVFKSLNAMTMKTSAIGWQPWLITFWYLWIWRNRGEAKCMSMYKLIRESEVSKCNHGDHPHCFPWSPCVMGKSQYITLAKKKALPHFSATNCSFAWFSAAQWSATQTSSR